MGYIYIPFAVDGDKTAIPDAEQLDGAVSQDEGFGFDYQRELGVDADAKPIPRDKFNWLMNRIETALKQYQTQGFFDFITSAMNGGAAYSYTKDSYVRYDDGGGVAIYRSLVDSNTADPTDATKWERIVYQNMPTGAGMDFYGTVAPTGWIFLDGRTIGNAASGATNRANADTAALFTLLWNSTSNAVLGIQDSTGAPLANRGASAAADYAANRRLPIPDARGRVIAGKDDMGSAAANRLTNNPNGGVVGSTLAASGGNQGHQLVVQELAAHSHSLRGEGGSSGPQNAVSFDSPNTQSRGGLVNNTGGDQAHNNVQPTLIANKLIKL